MSEMPDHEYVALEGFFRIAVVISRTSKSMTADLYRNLSDLADGVVMESGVTLDVASPSA